MNSWLYSIAAGIALCAQACGTQSASLGSQDASLPRSVDSASDVAVTTQPLWIPCDQTPGVPGAQCVLTAVPVSHTATDSHTLELGVKRIVPSRPVTLQVWLVEGGPGGSGVNSLVANARSLLQERNDVEVLAVDHRGVGGSVPLDCPDQESASSEGGAAITEAEWPPCAASLQARLGPLMNELTSENSARDLGIVIERFRRPGVPVIVHGISYGTYEVLRYLQFYPQQPSGVVLEGIVPLGFTFNTYDEQANAKARALFELCAADTECATRLGPDPWTTATRVIASFDSGHCPQLGLDTDGARAFLGGYTPNFPTRDYLPLLIYRMQRCNTQDIAAIAKFYEVTASSFAAFNDGRAVTMPAFFHIALSEMWRPTAGRDVGETLAAWRRTVISTGLSVQLAQRQAQWPTYPRPPVSNSLPAYAGPLLMLQGRLDPSSPVEGASTLRDAYRGQHQTWVEFPYGAHAVFDATPTTTGSDCGRQILFQFIANPSSELDTRCLSETLAPNFSGQPSYNRALLGTTNGWDG